MKLPAGLERALAPWIARGEKLLKEWEWTWARATVFSLGFAFTILVTVIVMPSAWMYFAEQKLHWGGPTDISEAAREVFVERNFWGPALKNEIRDAVAMMLTTGPFITFLVLAAVLQNLRRRLRGTTGD